MPDTAESTLTNGPEERSGLLDQAITGRRTVRAFQTAPVPREVVEEAVSAAGWAPSPHGSQPWRFVIIESAERRTMLADSMAAEWKRQLELDGQPEEIVAVRLQKGTARLTDAPLLMLVCLYLEDLDVYPDRIRQEAERIMAVQSLGAAVQNFLLTIYAAGYDAGWMCAPLFCPDIVRDALGLDTGLYPHALIPVGLPARDPVRKPRMRLEELIVSWE